MVNNLSNLQLRQTITNANVDYPTGRLRTGRQPDRYPTIREIHGRGVLRNLVINTDHRGSQIRLKDVADVQDTQKDASKIARQDGNSSIICRYLNSPDANAVEVSKAVTEQISKIEMEYNSSKLSLLVASDSSTFYLGICK